jgi:release factor glutamine methyltransferase
VSTTWTVGELVKWATDDFKNRGIEQPRLDAEVIVAFTLGVNRTQLILDRDRPLEERELTRLRELVKRRRGREPVAYLRGEREFYGRLFKVDRRVLIPRPDTEALVETALARTRAASMHARALDLCTGSGCVAITLGRERPTTRVLGIDISDDALAVARENVLRLGAYNVAFRKSDLYAEVGGPFELITANPPYIATAELGSLQEDVRNYEPRLALDGGEDGLTFLRSIVGRAFPYLVGGGVLAVEVGFGEAQAVKTMFEVSGFVGVEIARDYGQVERVVSGMKPSSASR